MIRTEMGKWADIVQIDDAIWSDLSDRVEAAYSQYTVYPPREMLFKALQVTPPESVRAVIIGQDPYHEPGQANGLSFSVDYDIGIPKSLQNIYKELQTDIGLLPASHGCLQSWADQGVLMLNSALTVEAHKAGSHKNFGWEKLTDAVITASNMLPQPIAFILWGNFAIRKQVLISSAAPRCILTSAHPSPLSAYRGFFGSRPFSKVNDFLIQNGSIPVDWTL